MTLKCCVVGCRSNYIGNSEGYVTVFKFPRKENDNERRVKWLRAIRRPDWIPKKNSSVCIKHFRENDVIRSDSYVDKNGDEQTISRKCPALKKDAIPSLFEHLPSYYTNTLPPRRKDPEERRKEIERRDNQQLSERLTSDVLDTFTDLVTSYNVRLKPQLKDNRWLVLLAHNQHLMFYQISELSPDSAPNVTVSIIIKQDMQLSGFVCGAAIDSSHLKTLAKNGRIEKWSQIENVLTRYQSVESTNNRPPITVSQVIGDIKVKLKSAAEMIINDVDCGPSKMLESLAEQAELAIAPDCRRRYSDSLRQFSCILYTKSPTCYRFLRKSSRLALPHERTLKKLGRAPAQLDTGGRFEFSSIDIDP